MSRNQRNLLQPRTGKNPAILKHRLKLTLGHQTRYRGGPWLGPSHSKREDKSTKRHHGFPSYFAPGMGHNGDATHYYCANPALREILLVSMAGDESSPQPDSRPSFGASSTTLGQGDHDAEMRFNTTPNLLTLMRMAFVPLVVGMLFRDDPTWNLIAAVLFGIAAITDYFDGYLARKHQIVTVYGKLLDPLADKFIVISSLVMLQQLGRIHPVIVILLICRELTITGLRALASAEGVIIAASGGGKWKTATQMIAIPFVMVKDGLFGIPLYPIGQVLLHASVGLSLWSGKDYVVDFFQGLKESRKQRAHERRIAREARKAARTARMAKKARHLGVE